MVWREYTRETPAKPGLALVSSIIALGLTTGLAYYVTSHKTPAVANGTRRELSNWPISFVVPKGFRSASSTDPSNVLQSNDGTEGILVYAKLDPQMGVVELHIEYQVVPDNLSMKRTFRRMTETTLEDGEAFEVGPLPGVYQESTAPDGRATYHAVGKSDEGLAVRVSLLLDEASPRARRLLETICSSIQLKEWTVRKR